MHSVWDLWAYLKWFSVIPGPHEFESREGRKDRFSGWPVNREDCRGILQDYLAATLKGCVELSCTVHNKLMNHEVLH
jgi:hypothetical protein